MPQLLTVITELENMAGVETEIREYRTIGATGGQYGEFINLAPNQRQEVSASKFFRRCDDCLRPAVLKIFVGGDDTGRVLKPHDFIDYSRIVFDLRENGQLVVRGVRDNSSFIYRIKVFRFLLRRNNYYQAMPEEEID